MNSAIKIENLSIYYANTNAINNLSVDFPHNEFTCILGPNGAGKTSLINSILGFIKANSGKIIICGKKHNKKKLSYVPQISDIDRNFPITVLETVLTAFVGKKLNPFKRYSKAETEFSDEILKKVGLLEYKNRNISELSGGEFQRLLIARAICSDPDIIILDEPTANVDISSSENIFEILKSLTEKITVIAVTHDLSLANKFADNIAVINKELLYFGKPKDSSSLFELLYCKKEKTDA